MGKMRVSKPTILGFAENGTDAKALAFRRPKITLGRSSHCALTLDGERFPAISRCHAQILWKPEAVAPALMDLHGAGGTFLNGHRVETETPLEQGDEIMLGSKGPRLRVAWENGDECLPERVAFLRNLKLFPLVFCADFSRRFREFQKVAEGSWGEVWRARRNAHSPWKAIKMLRFDRSEAITDESRLMLDRAVRRFQREIEITRQLAEAGAPNIVQAESIGLSPGGDFIHLDMEFIEGTTLYALVREQHPLPQALACRFLRQAAEGLDFAHNFEWTRPRNGERVRGVIHRDPHPENILIRADMSQALLCDFGLAAIEEGGSRLTRAEDLVGRGCFTPPEAMLERIISPAVDRWGLAATAYWTLSGGRLPFRDCKRPVPMLNAMRAGDIEPLERWRPDIAPELADLIRRALDPDPAKRPLLPEWIRVMRSWEEASVASPESRA
jgi:hypothetical protein